MRFTTTVERYILREAALTPFDVSFQNTTTVKPVQSTRTPPENVK